MQPNSVGERGSAFLCVPLSTYSHKTHNNNKKRLNSTDVTVVVSAVVIGTVNHNVGQLPFGLK